MNRLIIGCAAVLAFAAASPVASARDGSSGEVIRAWNEIARAQAFGNPVRLSRILAIMHAAQHDAVNGAEPRYETYASPLPDRKADAEAAAAAAAHRVLVSFFPANQAALDAELSASLASVPDGPAEHAGVALGRAVGHAVLDIRARRRVRRSRPVRPDTRPRSLGANPAGVRADARGPVPERPPVHAPRPRPVPARPAAGPDERQVRERLQRGQAPGAGHEPARTADQTQLAHFWAEGSPVGWSRVGSLVSSRYRYDLHRTARLLALLNMAMADGFIAGWYQKRHFAFWRPVTAIRKADTDGNPATSPDPTWLPLRPTPPLPGLPLDPQPPRRRRRRGPA